MTKTLVNLLLLIWLRRRRGVHGRHGSVVVALMAMTERWRPVRGFPGYEVSTKARVRNAATGLVMKPTIVRRGGYAVVGLRRNGASFKRVTHRLAAEAFGRLPPGSKEEINHRTGAPATRADIIRGIGPTAPHSSAYKGVSFDARRGGWYACITSRGRTRSLGLHDTEVAAARAYDKAARAQWGAAAYQNFLR
jgi:NUMOD4 motif